MEPFPSQLNDVFAWKNISNVDIISSERKAKGIGS